MERVPRPELGGVQLVGRGSFNQGSRAARQTDCHWAYKRAEPWPSVSPRLGGHIG
jgi:hypothetical protein